MARRSDPSPAAPPPRALLAAIAAALVLAVAVLYAPVRTHAFLLFDDAEYVTENPPVRAGLTLDGVRWAMTHSHSANWHPLTWMSHMADVSVWGMNAGGHLLVNVAFHAVNAVLVLLVLYAMTGALWPSAAVAALFALHPLRVESVAWVSERKDVLSAFFGLLALAAWTGWVRRGGAWRYVLVLLAFAASLMSKPMLVTLPVVLLLLDVWPFDRAGTRGPGWTRLVVEKLPLLGLSAAVAVTTVLVQHQAGAVVALDSMPLELRVRNAFHAYAAYVGTTLWPTGLAAFYPIDPDVGVGVPLLVLGAITAGVVACARRVPAMAVGWGWFLVMLLPVIGILKAGEQAMADRFTYLPGLGLLIALVWGVRAAAERWPVVGRAAGPATAVVLVACAALTARQVAVWQDTETLFRHALAHTTNNYTAHLDLGAALLLRGQVDEAEEHFRETVRIRPGWALAHANLARVATLRGDVAAAKAGYAEALRLEPDEVMAHFNLGLLALQAGDAAGAMASFRRTVELDPNHVKAWTALGQAQVTAEQNEEAERSYRRALALAPEFVPARGGLAVALEQQGRMDEALAEHRALVAMAPNEGGARFNLGAALLQAGKPAEAVTQLEMAARLMPDSAQARDALAAARAAAGRTADAGGAP